MSQNTFGYSTGWGPSGADIEVDSLRKINGILAGTAGVSIPVNTGGAGVVRTPAFTAATAGGTVAARAKSISFSSSSDFAGTIGGATFGPSQALVYAADGADTIGAIAYTVSAGTLNIATLT